MPSSMIRLSAAYAAAATLRAASRVDVLDGSPDSVRLRVDEEPFRNWATLDTVTAESGGGSWLNARADKIGNWEKFKLFTHPNNSSYRVFQAIGGHTWRADGDGGGLVDCRGMDPLGWEEFIV